MTTVVLAGATGFLGRHLAASLAGRDLTLVQVSRQRVAGMIQISDYASCPEADILIHLAEECDRGKVNELGRSYELQSLGIVTAMANRCKRLIYASSGMVYGDENVYPCTTDQPTVDSDAYSHSKLQNENVVLAAGGVVLRLSNLVGHGMSANNVVSHILGQVPGCGPVKVRDDKPVRDFLHVSDAVSAFARLIENPFAGVLNIGSGKGMSIRSLAELILASAGQESRTIVATAPAFKHSLNVLDISMTTEILGWTPAAPLRQCMAALVNNRTNAVS